MLEGRILVSAIMLVAFAAAVGLALHLCARSSVFSPCVIGITGAMLFSTIQLIKELRERPAPVVTSEERRREGRMFAWFIGFVGGLVLFGFLYAGPALVAAFLYFSGRERWYVALAAALFAWAVLYGVFELFLGLPLFEGLIFQWIFG